MQELLNESLERRGGARNVPTGGVTLPTRWLKYGFLGTINGKNFRKNHFLPSKGGLACSDGGYSPHSPPLALRCLKGTGFLVLDACRNKNLSNRKVP